MNVTLPEKVNVLEYRKINEYKCSSTGSTTKIYLSVPVRSFSSKRIFPETYEIINEDRSRLSYLKANNAHFRES